MGGLFGGGSKKQEPDPVKEATEANVAAEEKKVAEKEKKEIKKINAAKIAKIGGGKAKLMAKSTGGSANVSGAGGPSLASDEAVAFDLMENNDLYAGKRLTPVKKKLGVRNPKKKPGLMNIYS
tara:strand:- start:832 stop:1200 length:369 start_codon:yes stop_codon:yes gene_type:complete